MANSTTDPYRQNSNPTAALNKYTASLTYGTNAGLPAGGTSFSYGAIAWTNPKVDIAQTGEVIANNAIVTQREFQTFMKNAVAATFAARRRAAGL